MKSANKRFALTFIALTLFSTNTQAVSPSYSFVSVDYLRTELQDVPLNIGTFVSIPDKDVTFDGFQLTASFDFGNNWFGQARFQEITGDADHIIETPLSSFAPGSLPPGATLMQQVIDFDLSGSLVTISAGYRFFQDDLSSAYLAGGYAHTEVETELTYTIVYRDANGDRVTNPPGRWDSGAGSESGDDSGAILSIGYRRNLTDTLELDLRADHYTVGDSSTEFTMQGVYFLTTSLGLQLGGNFYDDGSQYNLGIRYKF
ncbi:outer membrane beta-barrel protein [Marinobacter sp. F4216]|uniref:outer membrane beta-barrel protein n=1 Tax=Marinobacter sp. F4216 TaxID=2874281 RepID=UPI001CBD0AB1|nr:outer membrane beta-barrel protein [Marinobacter sp. F4216]MBZ2168860.1 outer membrane beta-barrel protein [Marinobacter sp. F4216]